MDPLTAPHPLKSFLQRWLINTLAVLMAVSVVKGLRYEKTLDLFMASLLLGVLNTFLRPLILLLTLPLLIFTLGLFTFVINALLLYFVAYILRPHFYVDDFWSAFWGALVISLISLVLNVLTGTGKSRVKFHRGRRPPESDRDDGNGPVIDV